MFKELKENMLKELKDNIRIELKRIMIKANINLKMRTS
jgi:hypothetical protein